jgi:hypothetical protein
MSEQITTLERLMELAKEKRSVSVTGYAWPFFKCKPAAFVVNMSGSLIFRMIQSGMYLYEKNGSANHE